MLILEILSTSSGETNHETGFVYIFHSQHFPAYIFHNLINLHTIFISFDNFPV